MRLLSRLIILVLAAIGVKWLYDRFQARREELRGTTDALFNRTSSATTEMGASVAKAARAVASTAQTAAKDLSRTASAQADELRASVRRQADEVKSAAKEANDEATRDVGSTVEGSDAADAADAH